ncbi:MAG TPA: FKBP-type peptidyl-prolyl cis-trans isomerase [Solirubrobacterales bacterium]|jgi:peptidylprolyl isomerase|nr:FKBP-type peptidyl-prolyl cis-trans isomerase [Solirubrobacterales bacterium]
MRKGLLIIGMCLALAVAGCGGGSSSSDSTSAATTEKSSSPEEPSSPKASNEKASSPKPSHQAPAPKKPKVTVPKGAPPKKLSIKDLEKGSGQEAKAGEEVTVQYVGVGYKSKEQFDASWDRGEPFTFTLGSNSVIPGWEQGVKGMKVGGRRELTIPPNLAYGSAGAAPSIGPNETLIFVIDLVAAQ